MTNVADVEVSDNFSATQITSSLLTFTNEYEECAGILRDYNKYLGYYTSPGFWNPYIVSNNWAGLRLLFNAAWTVAKYPLLPRDWNNFAFWQKAISQKGIIPGISNKVDLGLYNGTPEQLKLWIADGCKPVVAPPDTEVDEGTYIIVTADPRLTMRSGPGTNYAALGSVVKGKKLLVLGVDYDAYNRTWYKVEFGTGYAYCAGWYTEPVSVDVPVEDEEYVIVTANPRLNLRSGPSTVYNVVGSANKGDKLLILGSSYDSYNRLWYNLSWNNKSVYGAGWYCEKV